MNKHHIGKGLAILASLVLLLTVAAPFTLGFLMDETQPLVNTFVPGILPDPDDLTVDITAAKTVNNTGEDTIGPENFAFVLKNTETGESTELRTDADGLAVFTLTFTAEDIDTTHSYTLSEVDEGKENIIYDETVYDIQITITADADDALIATLVCNDETVEKLVAEFVNTYDAEAPEVPPTGVNSELTLALTVLLISGAACAALILTRRKLEL